MSITGGDVAGGTPKVFWRREGRRRRIHGGSRAAATGAAAWSSRTPARGRAGLPARKEEHNTFHRAVLARVEHVFARMKASKILATAQVGFPI